MRTEFSRKVRAQAFLRCAGRCEKCHAVLKVGEAQYDHILPDGLEGAPTLENCQVLCRVCHKPKTADDIRRIRKADRARDKLSGAKKPKWPAMPGTKRSGIRKRMDGSVERW